MGQLLGADPDQLRDLGSKMDGSADQIDHVAAGITALLSFSRWEGADGERFRSEWNGPLRAKLTAAASAMRECGTTLRDNAAQQVKASDAEGGSSVLSLVHSGLDALDALAKLAEDMPSDIAAKLPQVVRGLAVDPMKAPEWGESAFMGLEVVLGAVSTAVDISEAMNAEPGSKEATTKRVDAVFDGASTVAAAAEFIPGAEPVATGALVVINLAHFGYDLVEANPELPGQVLSTVAQGVAAGVSGAERAAHAAETVISGGVHAALSWL